MIQGLIVLNHPTYVFERWHGTLLFFSVVLVAVLINLIISNWLPKVEGAYLILHILGFGAILITVAELAPHSDISTVFSTFLNEGGFSSQGLSFMVGLTGLAFAFVGADCAVHMSEEIANASVNVPRSIVLSIVINGLMGFGMLLVTLLGLGNIDTVLETPTGYPFIAIFLQATNSFKGTTAMTAIIIALAIGSSIGFIATSSRMIWSFARDRGLPFSDQLSEVDRRTSIPVYAILTTTIVSCLLALINIGSSSVFNDVISLSIAGFYLTYICSAGVLLYRRCTGGIRFPTAHETTTIDTATNEYVLYWGPFRIPGIWGILNNIFALCYLFVIFFFSFWPSSIPTTASTMNYSSLVFGAMVLFSSAYYILWGRKTYKGPTVEIEGYELEGISNSDSGMPKGADL